MNILTFDIEDWYHILHKYPSDILEKWNAYEDRIHIGTDKILEVLLENNVKAIYADSWKSVEYINKKGKKNWDRNNS